MNFGNNTYNSVPYMANPYYSQYAQPPVQQNTPPAFNEVKYANEREANSYMPNPNQRVLFFDTDNSIFRIKSTDAFGKSTIEAFKFEKITNGEDLPKKGEFDPKDFLKREDLNGFVNEEALNIKLEELNKSISKKIDDVAKKIKIQNILEEDK